MTRSEIKKPEQVAAETGISVETLKYWRTRGEGPKSFKLGRRVFYAQEDIDAWIEASRREAQNTRS